MAVLITKMISLLTDSKIANLPLMKIARYYGADNCDWYMPLMHNDYEKIYYSKIFNYTPTIDREDEMIIGGTGHDLKTVLPEEIEKCQPDYSIYPDCDYSLQYFSRGCIRKCKFCVVPEKEGYIYPVEAMYLNPKGKYIRILDNNFFANPLWKDAIKALIKIDQPVNFDSGLDIRIFTDEQGEALKKLKIYKMLHIAWDNPKERVIAKIKLMTKYIKTYKIMCYILIGFDSTKEEDYYRVMKVIELGCKPFVMPYNKKDKYQKKFANWVNQPQAYNVTDFKNFDPNNRKKYKKQKDDLYSCCKLYKTKGVS